MYMNEVPTPQLTVMDVFYHKQESQANNISNFQLGMGGNMLASSALMAGIPGVSSLAMVGNPMNPVGSKAIVLSFGIGRKYVIGFLDQTTSRIPQSPGETTVYSSYGTYTQFHKAGITSVANTGNIELNAPAGLVQIKTATYPGGSNFQGSMGFDALVAAYNDLQEKYNKILELLVLPVTNGKTIVDPASAIKYTALPIT